MDDRRTTLETSDPPHRCIDLFERAAEVLASPEKACRWMTSEQWALGGRVPLDMTRDATDAQEVDDRLGRTERGVPV